MAKKKRDGQAKEFLSHLYRDIPDGLVEVRLRGHDGKIVKRDWFADIDRLQRLVMDRGDRASKLACYYGVAKRTEDSQREKKATKKHVLGTSCLWADIDTDKHGWDMQRISKALYELPPVLQPTAVVCSGGGLHAYWMLTEPIYFDTREDQADVEELNKKLGVMVSGDRIFDITRVLRLPGSYNIRAKKQVDLVYFFHWAKKDYAELWDAANKFGMVLGPRGFVPPDQMPKAYREAREITPENVVALTLGNKTSRRLKEIALWTNTRPGGGYPYYGINEAELLSTCNQYFIVDHSSWPKKRAAIIDIVLDKVEEVMDKYPDQVRGWDWDAEEAAIGDKLDRWHERWAVLAKELGKQKREAEKAEKARKEKSRG